MRPRGWMLATVALAGALGWWAWRVRPDVAAATTAVETPAGESAPMTDSGGREVAPADRAAGAGALPPRPASLAAILAGRRTLNEGLNEALAVFGPKDPQLISAAGQAMLICATAPAYVANAADPHAGLLGGAGDAGKLAALEQLLAWCEGFDGRAFFAQLDTYQHKADTEALSRFGTQEQLDAAHRAIRRQENSYDLVRAGVLLLQRDQLPLREIFAGPPPLGKTALIGNWALAAELSTCASQLGCGPRSPPTLLYCFQTGCAAGLSYQQAVAAAIPARDYQAIVRFQNWIRSQHR